MVRAAIDIGTNTLLMLIEKKDKTFINEHRIARLGENLQVTGMISSNAMQRAAIILKEYKKLLDTYEPFTLKIVGTAALRNANNSKEVISVLSEVINCPIEIISGEEEATLTFKGTVENSETSVVVDIGGGSTEIVFGSLDTGIIWRKSFPFGAVVLTELCNNKENKSQIIRNFITPFLELIPKEIKFLIQNNTYIYANAGTPTTLASMELKLEIFDEKRVNGFVLQKDVLSNQEELLFLLNLEEIQKLPGVHPERADILPAGTSILLTLFQFFNLSKCIVSTKGLRYGVLQSIIY